MFNLSLEKVVRDAGEDRVMELNESATIMAYARMMLSYWEIVAKRLMDTVEKLIASSRNTGLIINEAKTKHLLIARQTLIKNDLMVGPNTFEQVDDFK